MPPTTAHQTDRSVTHNKLILLFLLQHSQLFLLLLRYIPTTNALIYWSVHHPFQGCTHCFLIFVVATVVVIAAVLVVTAIVVVVVVVFVELLSATSTAATATHHGFHSIPTVFCCLLAVFHHTAVECCPFCPLHPPSTLSIATIKHQRPLSPPATTAVEQHLCCCHFAPPLNAVKHSCCNQTPLFTATVIHYHRQTPLLIALSSMCHHFCHSLLPLNANTCYEHLPLIANNRCTKISSSLDAGNIVQERLVTCIIVISCDGLLKGEYPPVTSHPSS
jgi:hypothetical protein